MTVDVELILSETMAQAMLGRALLARLVDDVPFSEACKATLMELAESLDLVEGARVQAMLREAGDL